MSPDACAAIAHTMQTVQRHGPRMDFYGRDTLRRFEDGLVIHDRHLATAHQVLVEFREIHPWANVIEAVCLIEDEQILRNEERGC